MISVSNYTKTIQQVDIKSLPSVLQEGHDFFLESNHWYNKDEMVKETIDLYLKKLNDQLSKAKTVDQDFVAKFLDMHNKVRTKRQLGLFIRSIQKAIITKKIRKSSLVARHIARMQEVLVNQYNKLPENEKTKITISDSWRDEMRSALKSTGLDGFDQLSILGSSIKKQQTERSNLFNSMNEIDEGPSANSFRLAGDLGVLLGDLERFELALTLEGDQGGGKTRFSYQLTNAFADIGMTVAMFSLEIGRKSDLVRRMREEYLEEENRSDIFITDQLPEGFDTIRKAAKDFDVIIIDSWNKLYVKSSEFDRLRKEFPSTIFIIIFQRTTQGTIRGGTAPLFDSGINLEVVKADDTFMNNYVVATKNRYGVTGIRYNITRQEIINHFEEQEDGKGQ